MPPNEGMRFWLPSQRKLGNTFVVDKKEPWGDVISRRTWPNIDYKGKALYIYGERWISDAAVARQLIESPGILQFRPQDAIDCGYISRAELEALGYTGLVDKPGVAKEKPKGKTKAPAPDLDTMNHDELVEFCGDNKINIDIRKDKPSLLVDVKKELKARKRSRSKKG